LRLPFLSLADRRVSPDSRDSLRPFAIAAVRRRSRQLKEHVMSKMLSALAASVLIVVAVQAQAGGPEITDAWARATPGGAKTGAAYLTVESATGDRLTGVSTPAADKAELHTMKMENGVMKMNPLPAVDLPAGKPVTLKPGGTHIMLFGLKHPLQAGGSLPLTLHFEKGGTREVMAAIGKVGAMGPDSHTGGGMHMPMPAKH
jgi:copper(I)-binding protein